MKRIKFLAVIAIVALAGCLIFACSGGGGSDSEADGGGSPKNGWNGKPGTGGSPAVSSNALTDPADIIDALGSNKVEYDESSGWKIKADITIPSDGIIFGDVVSIPDAVTITIPSGSGVLFEYKVTADGDLTIDGGGNAIFGDDADIAGELTITNGTVAIQVPSSPPSKTVTVTVTGDTTIGQDGALLVPEKAIVVPSGDLDVSGKLDLNGQITIPNGQAIIFRKGDGGNTTNTAFAVTGTGNLSVEGDMEVYISTDQFTNDMTAAFPMASGATADFTVGSSLVVKMDNPDIGFSNASYNVFGSSGTSPSPDYSIDSGKVIVQKTGSQVCLYIANTYDSDGVIDDNGAVTVKGGFYPTDPTQPRVVFSWSDIVVKTGGMLTVDVSTSGTAGSLVIREGYTLKTEPKITASGVDVVSAGTVKVTAGTQIVNLGTFINNGAVENAGGIYKGFSGATSFGTFSPTTTGTYSTSGSGTPSPGTGSGSNTWNNITWSTSSTPAP